MRKIFILAVLLCGSLCAFADPTEFTFIGWQGDSWQNGYPYYIMESSGNPTILDVMCDDYAHGGEPGQQWDANITDLGSGNIQLTRFNVSSSATSLYSLMLYDEAGWILLQTAQEPTSQWQSMNSAVWNILDPSAPCDRTCQTWINAAKGGIQGLPQSYFKDVFIVTPVNQHDPDPNSMQEFMYIGEGGSFSGQNQTMPEPGTLVLMDTGVVALFGRQFPN